MDKGSGDLRARYHSANLPVYEKELKKINETKKLVRTYLNWGPNSSPSIQKNLAVSATWF